MGLCCNRNVLGRVRDEIGEEGGGYGYIYDLDKELLILCAQR